MSRRNDNRHRVATICRRATGLAHETCMQWAAEGLITRSRPVPDAGTPEQQAFEARLLAALGGGAVLGLTGIRPSPAEPVVSLDPVRAHEVIDAVWPRLDGTGAVHGVPGLRLVRDDGAWWFTDAADQARVRLEHPSPGWRPRPSPIRRQEDRSWRDHRPGRYPVERPGAYGPASRDRDRLLSRIFRRLGLITKAGAEHGWVSLSTTGTYDLVIDCCCASGAVKLMDGLRRSALVDREEDDSGYPGDVDLGEASLAVRHASCGSFPEPVDLPRLRWATC
ncbi:hypothetical protein [Streptomyces sp. NPDC058157]|uniref:hypothetical protein n=1 Tax=Streptomyces sp. NPDC058157 TaxID=3346360 RepID=UPI0036EE3190